MFLGIEFAYPFVLLLILPYILCQFLCQAAAPKIFFSNFRLLKELSSKSFDYTKLLKILIATLLLIALSAPFIVEYKTKTTKEGIDIALAFDLSSSMEDNNKFTIAKKTLIDFITKRISDNIAVIVFANKALIASPLTNNTKALIQTLHYLKPGIAGSRDTALYEALYKSITLLENSKAKSKVVILLTDGVNTIKRVPLEIALQKAKKHHIRVYTIGVGKEGDFNKKELEYIAKTLDGKFFATNNPKKLQDIYNTIDALEKAKVIQKHYKLYKNLSFYPLIAALVLMFYLAFRKRYNTKELLFILLSLFFALIALFKLQDNLISQNNQNSVAIALDCSDRMYVDDLYPNRLEFAKVKLKELLSKSNTQITLLAFNKKPYLISANSNDMNATKYLLEHLNCSNIQSPELNFLALLEALEQLALKKVIIATATSTQKDFSKEQAFITKHNLKVTLYALATKEGGVAKKEDRVLTNKDGSIVVSYLNPKIATLANSGFIEASLDKSDIKALREKLQAKNTLQATKEINIWILLSFMLFFIGSNSFRREV